MMMSLMIMICVIPKRRMTSFAAGGWSVPLSSPLIATDDVDVEIPKKKHTSLAFTAAYELKKRRWIGYIHATHTRGLMHARNFVMYDSMKDSRLKILEKDRERERLTLAAMAAWCEKIDVMRFWWKRVYVRVTSVMSQKNEIHFLFLYVVWLNYENSI